MPVVHSDIAALIKLYRRCKRFKVLPRAGGVFEQDEIVMDLMEFIDGEVGAWEAKRHEEREGELMKQRLSKGLPHG